MRTTSRNTLAVFAIAAAATLGLAACSSSGSGDMTGDTSKDQSQSTPKEDSSSDAGMADPAADLVGPGCQAYADEVPDGPGSIEGMSADPVAVAASNNPMLTTLVSAVSGKLNPDVNLVDTLNGDEFTVFAPVDDAFAKLDPATVDSLKTPEGADMLKTILTYHVVPGQIAPDAIAGEHETVEGESLEVTGSGDDLMVGDASVICGGVHTANATVYLIDSVLMPPSI
ncbi:Uncaracterized surface protein containing fasciclin (FAS1) repeats [Paramicrobacterium humi]|uniref:Uncaracterized surface protein containing fasciclin (FAS1) repeats n=1 Tax=Paramicrobacterium humi TaxID=640635 RepID=A0A1H4N960_9MICO|nr:fasciclin domain-containing protein [Microbacterium humi]SEB91793.1 Uncaracterized surface protein containing fasciclin (FAS1) repeats [Microbacterium humi]